jgi:hypothetical protein
VVSKPTPVLTIAPVTPLAKPTLPGSPRVQAPKSSLYFPRAIATLESASIEGSLLLAPKIAAWTRKRTRATVAKPLGQLPE